ncbi:MAG TPA: Fur family transcriptional regulator [Chloroflexia bacterium]|nr:Fur family transcriptional regulator [Chloroflexia bacterium]
MPDVESLWERLVSRGFKRTQPRQVVLAEVAARRTPFTAAGIVEAVQEQVPGIGRATVFRTLDMLAGLGVLHPIQDDGGHGAGQAYLVCEPVHHHHLICSSCNAVWDFVESELEARIATVARSQAFQLEGHRLELYGLCAACRTTEPA